MLHLLRKLICFPFKLIGIFFQSKDAREFFNQGCNTGPLPLSWKSKNYFFSRGGGEGLKLFHALHLKKWKDEPLNPIPAEVLENQDTLGGGQFDPPL